MPRSKPATADDDREPRDDEPKHELREVTGGEPGKWTTREKVERSEPRADGADVNLDDLLQRAAAVPHNIETVPASLARAMVSLQLSNIITIEDNAVTWRTGHLEHIANLYAGDPLTTERDYADDLAVARAYSAELWGKLTGVE